MANEVTEENRADIITHNAFSKKNLNTNGVKDYHKKLVLTFLILKASCRQTTTYEDINEHLEQRGLNWVRDLANITAHRELTQYLTDIFHWCRERNQPQLTSLVVRKSGADQGLPGKGFWDLLNPDKDLQFVDLNDRKTKATMTRLFQNQVFDYYSSL